MTADTSVTQSQEAQQDANRPTVLDLHGYRVGKVLGQGSYAIVREAYSQRHKSRVAIKIISKKKAPDDYVEKFLPREIDVVKLLKHPNLVVFLQSIETNNRVYLVMEHASGGDMLDIIRQQKLIPEKKAGVWFGQMVEAMDYCHMKGVVHRDLKCENILLDEYQNLKVTDFGFARAGMKPKPGGEYLLSETYCGSYAYASPEILTGTPYAPQYADIWSMGVILYVMVVGRLPFDDSNHRKLLRQVTHGPQFPEKRQLTTACKDVITKILVKVPARPSIRAIRSQDWFQIYCQPVLDLVQMSEDDKPAVYRAQSEVKQDKPAVTEDKNATNNNNNNNGNEKNRCKSMINTTNNNGNAIGLGEGSKYSNGHHAIGTVASEGDLQKETQTKKKCSNTMASSTTSEVGACVEAKPSVYNMKPITLDESSDDENNI